MPIRLTDIPEEEEEIEEVGRFSLKRILPSAAYTGQQRLTDIPETTKGIRLTDIPEAPTKGIRLTDIPDVSTKGIRLTDIMTGEEDPWQKMSKFGKVMDIIGRPGYAFKSLLRQTHRDGLAFNKKIDEARKRGATSEQIEQMHHDQDVSNEMVKRQFRAVWDGLTGKERLVANEMWGDIGVKGKPFLGFATEIATDPLMWAGGAGYKEIAKRTGQLLGLGRRAITKIPGVTPTAIKIAEKARPITEGLRGMFVTKTHLPGLNNLIDKLTSKRQYLRVKETKYAIKVRNVIQNIAKKTGRSIDDIEREVVNIIELPQKTVPSITEAKVLANTIKSHLSGLLTREMKAGVPITALSKNIRGIQYFPRITTAEARQYLKGATIGKARVWNTKLANALRRKTEDFTLEEFNAFVAEHGLKGLGGRSVEEFFMKQPAYAVATRGIRSAKATTSAQFLRSAGRLFGRKEAPGHWEELPPAVTKLNKYLRGLNFDPEVAKEITRVTKSYFNPNEAKVFLRGFDTVQNLWKKWTLAPFPKYHLRNMVGNMWNNYLAGVNPKQYPKAQALQMYRKYKGTGRMGRWAEAELKKFGIKPDQADDIIKWGEKTGVVGRGWYAADIPTAIEQELKATWRGLPIGAKVKKVVTGRIVTEKGMAFGSTVENNARLAHFLDRLDKGDDALVAAKSVKKFLFDYGDLTAFEKQVMKRLFPFYTWTRKNVPLQLEKIWTQPQKFAPLAIPLRQRKAKDLLRLKYARPDLYERLPVELRRDANTVTYVPLEGLIPAGDLVKLGESAENIKNLEIPDFLVELLTPYLRAPIELKVGKSFYFESEIERYPKQTQPLLRMDIPVKYKYAATTILPQARLINELNKLIKKQTRREELTTGEQAFSQGLSSIYKINVKDLRQRALFSIEKKIQDLKRGMFWAKRNKREAEYKRIKQTYEEMKTEFKKLKAD